MILTHCRIYHGAYNLSGDLNSLELSLEAETQDITTFNDNGWTKVAPGLKTGNFSYEGYFTAGSGSISEHLNSEFATTDTTMTLATSENDGVTAYLTKSATAQVQVLGGSVGEAGKITASGTASTDVVRGTILIPSSSAKTSTGTGTGRQLGALSAAQTFYASLHVLSVSGTGTPSLTVKIQSDDNSGFTSPTDQITFSAATAAGAQWGSKVGAVTDNYWRVSYTISGTNPSFTFVVAAGIGDA